MKENINLEKILSVVASFYGINKEKIISRSREGEFVIPRQVYMYLAFEHTEKTLADIAWTIDRDHSTAIYAIKKIKNEIELYPELKNEIDRINEMLLPSIVVQDVDLLLLTENYTKSFIN